MGPKEQSFLDKNGADDTLEDEEEEGSDTFASLPSTATREKGNKGQQRIKSDFGGRNSLLRQPSCKAVWGK